MDPNNQPPVVPPVPPQSPSPQPQTTPQPQLTPVPTQPLAPAFSANSKPKRRLPRLVVIVIVLLVLIGGGLAYASKSKPSFNLNFFKKFSRSSSASKTPSGSGGSGSSGGGSGTAVNSGAKCLNLSDFPTDQANDYAQTEVIFFNADSTDYQFPEQLDQNLQPIINAYNKYKDRKFKIAVTGSVKQGDNKSQALGQARATKVIGELTSRGIPSNVLYMGNPQDSANDPNSPLAADDSNRNAAIEFDTCSPNDPNYIAS